jgi:dihydropteroate synthase
LEKIGFRDKDVPMRSSESGIPVTGASGFTARGRQVSVKGGPLIMGIINVNDDSFSGDGRIDAAWALDRARELAGDGADIIDIGAESARTNRAPVSEREEIRRLLPVVAGFAGAFAGNPAPPLLSVNAWRPGVAERILSVGGDILNDMGGLADDRNARICAATGASLLIMHTVGEPKVSHGHVTYADILGTLAGFFEEKIAMACEAGVAREAILLDPGIDFAKQAADNLAIYGNLGRLHALGRPILLPVSLKGVIGRVLGIADPAGRDAGTAACIVAGMLRGASLFRVHNVRMARETIAAVAGVTGSARQDEP